MYVASPSLLASLEGLRNLQIINNHTPLCSQLSRLALMRSCLVLSRPRGTSTVASKSGFAVFSCPLWLFHHRFQVRLFGPFPSTLALPPSFPSPALQPSTVHLASLPWLPVRPCFRPFPATRPFHRAPKSGSSSFPGHSTLPSSFPSPALLSFLVRLALSPSLSIPVSILLPFSTF